MTSDELAPKFIGVHFRKIGPKLPMVTPLTVIFTTFPPTLQFAPLQGAMLVGEKYWIVINGFAGAPGPH